jgi:hypothetical protein
MVQMSWRVDHTATEKRNMSVAARPHTEAGRRQAGDGDGVSVSEEKSGRRLVR